MGIYKNIFKIQEYIYKYQKYRNLYKNIEKYRNIYKNMGIFIKNRKKPTGIYF